MEKRYLPKQINIRVTEEEEKTIMEWNDKLFNGKQTKSRVARALVRYALQQFSSANIEQKHLVTVNDVDVNKYME